MEKIFDMLVIGQQSRKILEKRCERLSEIYDVRLVEMDILYFLSRAGIHDTAKDIMSEMHISKAHISKSVENLKKKGFLAVREDVMDHRCFHLHITEKADPLLRDFMVERRRFRDMIFQGVTEEEKEVVVRAAKKIVENLSRAYDKI